MKRRMVRVPESGLPWLGVAAFGWGAGWVYPAPAPGPLREPQPRVQQGGRVVIGSGVPGTIEVSTLDELHAAIAKAEEGKGPMTIQLPRGSVV